jgi:hypothetical protein
MNLRTPTPSEFAELENLYNEMIEYEGLLLPIGRHANLRQYIYEHFGVLELDREKMKRIARELLSKAASRTQQEQDYIDQHGDE